jgi:uncharacterized protein YvpB
MKNSFFFSIGLTGLLLLTACSEPETVINTPVGASSSSASLVTAEPDTAPGTTIDPPISSSMRPGMAAPNQSSSIPASVRIDMPFAPQAPTGSWDPPYDEACEEASLIIVHHYLESTALDNGIMDRDIKAMVAHETAQGLPIDIDMLQLADVARDLYGYDAEVLEGSDVSIARIEQELAQGNPVIVPLAGQDIGNPYYSGDGPPYHVLVIVGYDNRNFITHDVGTKRGENYVYRKEVIMDAIHDWNGSVDTIRSGPRRLLIVKK